MPPSLLPSVLPLSKWLWKRWLKVPLTLRREFHSLWWALDEAREITRLFEILITSNICCPRKWECRLAVLIWEYCALTICSLSTFVFTIRLFLLLFWGDWRKKLFAFYTGYKQPQVEMSHYWNWFWQICVIFAFFAMRSLFWFFPQADY